MHPIVAVIARLFAKQKRTCPKCKHAFTVPPAQARAVVPCPKCKAKTGPPAMG